jgi:RNA polymerase sigma factor (sigma-70 family)
MTHASTAERLATFEKERPHLLCVAFRILGSELDAEDVVQEAWIRYAQADRSQVQNLAAWLTTVVSRLCLDALRRRRVVPRTSSDLLLVPESEGHDPEAVVLLGSELIAAFMLLLDELSPPQRVALVLHDGFGVPFEEVAHVLGTSPGSAKKLASRARGRLRQRGGSGGVTPRSDTLDEVQRVVQAFMLAAQQGDTAQLVTLLDPNVVRTADPQVLQPGRSQHLRGVDAVVSEAIALQSYARRAKQASINGRPGIVVLAGQDVQAALVFRIDGGKIVHYDVVADPHRLGRLRLT